MENPVNARPRRLLCTVLAASVTVLALGGVARAQEPPAVALLQIALPDPSPLLDPQLPAAPPPPAAVQEIPQAPAPFAVLSNMRIRGYADVGFGKPPQEKLPEGGLQGSKESFQIADLHLFVTAKLADEWSFLGELLITSDFSNETSAEMDRLLFQYNPSKHFKVGFGKFNSGVGYYSNEFHRAKFFQTATGRPLMFTDEDNGGILPVHQIGITAQGEIPSGSLGLHYIGEISNGRSFSGRSSEVQNFTDGNNGKAVNAGLFARPDALPGLDAGFTVYRDTLEPEALGKIRETITAVHAVYLTPNFEFLNEVAILKHDTEATGATASSKSFYTQVSNRFGLVRPYVRYEYQNVPESDPVFGVGDIAVAFGVRKVVSAGVHLDIHDFAVVKFQFDHALQFGVWASGVNAQLAFAF